MLASRERTQGRDVSAAYGRAFWAQNSGQNRAQQQPQSTPLLPDAPRQNYYSDSDTDPDLNDTESVSDYDNDSDNQEGQALSAQIRASLNSKPRTPVPHPVPARAASPPSRQSPSHPRPDSETSMGSGGESSASLGVLRSQSRVQPMEEESAAVGAGTRRVDLGGKTKLEKPPIDLEKKSWRKRLFGGRH
ncbi:hypothetical protein V5O48_006663 [Marasmius crinis-equi]|uniref:Uncharacterized protein n=1 Tax=Marasmius crinis-equi TaxID=585013 RepID=A0ABR3FIX7_9AGAR